MFWPSTMRHPLRWLEPLKVPYSAMDKKFGLKKSKIYVKSDRVNSGP